VKHARQLTLGAIALGALAMSSCLGGCPHVKLRSSGKILIVGGAVTAHSGARGFDATSGTQVYDQRTRTFAKLAATMNEPRMRHTTSRLDSGKMLVAGGENADGGYLASAELLDPGDRKFYVTGPMSTPRSDHTATVLIDGRVLVTGGLGAAQSAPRSAEIYDPIRGEFAPTGTALAVERFGHTAAVLANKEVLIVGGSSERCAEIFDPRTYKLRRTRGDPAVARRYHTATPLGDGRVLIVGGRDVTSGAPLDSAELFDPATEMFFATKSPMHVGRERHAASRYESGVLITGGRTIGGAVLRTAEVFDPKSQSFRSLPNLMLRPRADHSASFVPVGPDRGAIVLIGGDVENLTVLGSAELFDPSLEKFIATANTPNPGVVFHTADLLR
ncbi:MAG: Kelch repeat-containing protein, partial [Candidatus Binataceae bacterium]